MNLVRMWILRLAALIALGFSASLLYDSYQDLTWTRRAIAEAGASYYSKYSRVGDEILAESVNKERNGTVKESAGLGLAASAFIMEALAAALKRLNAPKN